MTLLLTPQRRYRVRPCGLHDFVTNRDHRYHQQTKQTHNEQIRADG